MGPPSVQYNTYVQSSETVYIDTISKVYLIGELIVGLNRLPVFANMKPVYIFLALAYSALLQTFVIYKTVTEKIIRMTLLFSGLVKLGQFVFGLVFSFISWKRLQLYYTQLNKFDMDVGCRPCISKGSIKNTAMLIINLAVLLLLYFLPYQFDQLSHLYIPQLFVNIYNISDVYFYGHLLNLLTPRLRLINHYLGSSLMNIKHRNSLRVDEFIFFKRELTNYNYDMKKIMDLYHTIIKAYDFLIEAIKWQLLLMIIETFTTNLGIVYHCSYNVIHNRNIAHSFIPQFGLTIIILLPLFSPCIFGDQMQGEVRRLRELLASRIYENKLDKSSRGIARALLAFTETRDLSFTLLRILNIDISLPFKFVGLLVTYLIILLQFEKVFNP